MISRKSRHLHTDSVEKYAVQLMPKGDNKDCHLLIEAWEFCTLPGMVSMVVSLNQSMCLAHCSRDWRSTWRLTSVRWKRTCEWLMPLLIFHVVPLPKLRRWLSNVTKECLKVRRVMTKVTSGVLAHGVGRGCGDVECEKDASLRVIGVLKYWSAAVEAKKLYLKFGQSFYQDDRALGALVIPVVDWWFQACVSDCPSSCWAVFHPCKHHWSFFWKRKNYQLTIIDI